jgi:hypothetical protein
MSCPQDPGVRSIRPPEVRVCSRNCHGTHMQEIDNPDFKLSFSRTGAPSIGKFCVAIEPETSTAPDLSGKVFALCVEEMRLPYSYRRPRGSRKE